MGGKSGYELPFITGVWLVSSLVNTDANWSLTMLAFAKSSVMSSPLLDKGGIPLGSLYRSRISC